MKFETIASLLEKRKSKKKKPKQKELVNRLVYPYWGIPYWGWVLGRDDLDDGSQNEEPALELNWGGDFGSEGDF